MIEFPKELEGIAPKTFESETVLSDAVVQGDLLNMMIAFHDRPEINSIVRGESEYQIRKALETHDFRLMLNAEGTQVTAAEMVEKCVVV